MGINSTIDGVQLIKLKQIIADKGNVYHGLKNSDTQFSKFGEAYFSTVNLGEIKAWKLHTEMISNIIVPHGEVKFVLWDNRQNSPTIGNILEVKLSLNNYYRLTIPSNIWFGFMGLSKGVNLLCNIASVEHNPEEALTLPILNSTIPFIEWNE